jgi:hypothetical protein
MQPWQTALLEAVLTDGAKKKLPCAAAFSLSHTYDVSLREIGAYCEANGIRIASCQLGCFS